MISPWTITFAVVGAYFVYRIFKSATAPKPLPPPPHPAVAKVETLTKELVVCAELSQKEDGSPPRPVSEVSGEIIELVSNIGDNGVAHKVWDAGVALTKFQMHNQALPLYQEAVSVARRAAAGFGGANDKKQEDKGADCSPNADSPELAAMLHKLGFMMNEMALKGGPDAPKGSDAKKLLDESWDMSSRLRRKKR
eukprot:CAMPEP_0201521088 /NCGR_PEP_ID=MMETSP0161_2-20130828/14070_1 /ASSEMBLY_ACC=CAM_ASM_000251 /TAXON_ID=180227 /ORGANISM="Neoparamoeba aestuarina, Strain SoJaBio B1-5/56/2" /LENGTH=194 /DNA_ID=CAMNT_0047919655 /DNA_START=142 /DNA_END=726 /DNA_ORIENTATION=+